MAGTLCVLLTERAQIPEENRRPTRLGLRQARCSSDTLPSSPKSSSPAVWALLGVGRAGPGRNAASKRGCRASIRPHLPACPERIQAPPVTDTAYRDARSHPPFDSSRWNRRWRNSPLRLRRRRHRRRVERCGGPPPHSSSASWDDSDRPAKPLNSTSTLCRYLPAPLEKNRRPVTSACSRGVGAAASKIHTFPSEVRSASFPSQVPIDC